jgi:hypothetical protein
MRSKGEGSEKDPILSKDNESITDEKVFVITFIIIYYYYYEFIYNIILINISSSKSLMNLS